MELVFILTASDILWDVSWCWSFAQPDFRHHQAWAHAAPAQHVERQEAGPPHDHGGRHRHAVQQLRLQTCPPLSCLGNQEDSGVLEKPLVVVESLWAHLLELRYPLSPQDLLDSRAALPDAGRAAGTHRVAGCGYEGTGDAGGDPHHVVKNTIIHRVDFVVHVEFIGATGGEAEQVSPAGLGLLGLGHQLLYKDHRLACAGITQSHSHGVLYLQHGPLQGEGVTELLSTRVGDELLHQVGRLVAAREQSPLPGGHTAAVVPGLNIPSWG